MYVRMSPLPPTHTEPDVIRLLRDEGAWGGGVTILWLADGGGGEGEGRCVGERKGEVKG